MPARRGTGRLVSTDHRPVDTRRRYSWRHNWVPLTMAAALQKAKGNRALAEQLLERARAGRRRRDRGPAVFTTPHPAHQAEHAARSSWAAFTDDDLAGALGKTDDDAVAGAILAELDRRDAAERKAQRARERRQARRTAEEERHTREFDAACDAGEDPEEAYARVYGVTEEKRRRAEAEESLRAGGYTGRTFRDRVKAAHAGTVREAYLHAETLCRGHLLSPAGKRAGVHPESLFSGPPAAAKKYASEELLAYFRDHGRLTLQDFTAGILGGRAKFRTTGDDW
jgi:hypothetical protein